MAPSLVYTTSRRIPRQGFAHEIRKAAALNSTDRPASAPDKTARRRKRAAYIIAAAIFAAIVLALVGRHLYYRSKINAELDAISKAGFPVTLQELSDYYPVPQGENAAEVYTEAFAKFTEKNSTNDLPVVGMGKLPSRNEPLPKQVQTAISAYLTSNAQALELLQKAATTEGCRFDVAFSAYPFRLPHLAQLRQAARLLELDALMKVEEGKADKAAAATAASFAAAHSLRNEPILISQLVRIAVDSISLSTLERVLSRTTLGDKQLTELSATVTSEEKSDGFKRGMVGERCEGDYMFLNLRTLSEEDAKVSALAFWFYKYSDEQAQDRIANIRFMAEVLGPADRKDRDIGDLLENIGKGILPGPNARLLIGMKAPALARACEEDLKNTARLRAARAGIAVERFRLANGRLPDSLEELVPKWLDAVPADPFDDKPIRYRKLDKGFVTYSIGPDLKDDGGKERNPIDSNAPYDITFIVAR